MRQYIYIMRQTRSKIKRQKFKKSKQCKTRHGTTSADLTTSRSFVFNNIHLQSIFKHQTQASANCHNIIYKKGQSFNNHSHFGTKKTKMTPKKINLK